MLAHRVLLEYEEGRDELGDIFLQRLLQVPIHDTRGLGTGYIVRSFVVPLVGPATGRTQGLETVRVLGESTVSSTAVPPLLTTMARAGLALLAVIESDVMAAREQYDALQPHRGKLVPNCAGCTVDRLLGLLSQTMGNLDQAAAHFEDALAFCRKAGYRPELAWSCCDYSDILRERDAEGDRAKAMSLLDESLAISGELGMRPLKERVLARREMVGA